MKHILVPKHRILKKEEKEEILKKLNVKIGQFPKILKNDSAIRDLNPEKGDLVEITRNSSTTGKTIYYRVVVLE